MTGKQRVRIVADRRTWLTGPMAAADAQAFMQRAAEQVRTTGDGPRLLAFPDVENPVAFIRARDVTAIELVNLPTPGPAKPAGGPSIGATP